MYGPGTATAGPDRPGRHRGAGGASRWPSRSSARGGAATKQLSLDTSPHGWSWARRRGWPSPRSGFGACRCRPETDVPPGVGCGRDGVVFPRLVPAARFPRPASCRADSATGRPRPRLPWREHGPALWPRRWLVRPRASAASLKGVAPLVVRTWASPPARSDVHPFVSGRPRACGVLDRSGSSLFSPDRSHGRVRDAEAADLPVDGGARHP